MGGAASRSWAVSAQGKSLARWRRAQDATSTPVIGSIHACPLISAWCEPRGVVALGVGRISQAIRYWPCSKPRACSSLFENEREIRVLISAALSNEVVWILLSQWVALQPRCPSRTYKLSRRLVCTRLWVLAKNRLTTTPASCTPQSPGPAPQLRYQRVR